MASDATTSIPPTAAADAPSSSSPPNGPPRVVIEDVTDQEAEQAAHPQTDASSSSGTMQQQEHVEEAPGPVDDPEERSRKLAAAEDHKQKGNDHYRAGRYDDALEEYREAVQQAPQDAAEQLAVYWANAAACHLQLDQAVDCVHCCSAALEHSPQYVKALLRRSAAYERLDELDKALKDAQQAVECDPGCGPAAAAVKRLQPIVEERNEKLKEETLAKLKDLGNTLLGKFGLSLDSFQTEKDPTTGSYSIKFNNS